MPFQNIDDVKEFFPFVSKIKKALPNANFEVISIDGTKKLKLYLDVSHVHETYELSCQYDDNFEHLPQEVKDHLRHIEIADVTFKLMTEQGVKQSRSFIASLLPNVKDLEIINAVEGPIIFPARYFNKLRDEVASLENLRYPEGVIHTIDFEALHAIERGIAELSKLDIKAALSFDKDNHCDRLAVDELLPKQLSKISSLDSLQKLTLFSLIQDLSFSTDFENPEEVSDQFSKLTQLFPNLEHLRISKNIPNTDSNIITQDFDFSAFSALQRLESLDMPVTAIGDFAFLNDMQQLSELTLSPPINGYDPLRSNEKIRQCITQIYDDKAEEITTIKMNAIPLYEETFNALCHEFKALKELSITTSQVGSLRALTDLPQLEKLSIDNLVLEEGPILTHLSELRLSGATSDSLKSFDVTSRVFPNLEKLHISSTYENSCTHRREHWNNFTKGIASLPDLRELDVLRSLQTSYAMSGGKYSARSGGAIHIEIDQNTIDALSQTNVEKLSLSGFGRKGSRDQYGISKQVLEAVKAQRETSQNQKASSSMTSTSAPETLQDSVAKGNHH